jgi:conjugal transfer pilus assembly protein TraD
MSSEDPNKYNFPFRTNYEMRITAIWFVAGFLTFLCPYVLDVPERVYQIFGLTFMFLGVVLGRHGIEIYIKKSRLKGYDLEFIDPNSAATLKMFGIKDKEVVKNVCKRKQ